MGGAAFEALAGCIQASASLQDLQVPCRSINKAPGMGQALLQLMAKREGSEELLDAIIHAPLWATAAPPQEFGVAACLAHSHPVLQVLASSLVPFAIVGYNPGKGAVDAVLQQLAQRGPAPSPASARSLLSALSMLQASHQGAKPLTSTLWNSLMEVASKDQQFLLRQGDGAAAGVLLHAVACHLRSRHQLSSPGRIRRDVLLPLWCHVPEVQVMTRRDTLGLQAPQPLLAVQRCPGCTRAY